MSDGVRKLLSSMWTNENIPGNKAAAMGFTSGESSPQGSTPSSDSPEAHTGEARPAKAAAGELSPTDGLGGSIRRNYTASALATFGAESSGSADASEESVSSRMRRNVSASALVEIRRRELLASSPHEIAAMQGSRAAVVEAMACMMLEHMLGVEAGRTAMRAAMREKAATVSDGSSSGSSAGSSSSGSSDSDGAAASAPSSEGKSASFPEGISAQLQAYILTIVRHLELPNSCIVASLIYVQRAVQGTRFTLSLTNWQPCLLAAFVVAAKLSFDEPVWNEDFVKALRISNVQVCQISRWEADFLQLLHFETNVEVAQYASACFMLQKTHEQLHGKPCHFFTYLMSLSKAQGA